MAEDRYKNMVMQTIGAVMIASVIGIGGLFTNSVLDFTQEVADNTKKQSELNYSLAERLVLLETYQSVFRHNMLQSTERANIREAKILTLQFDVNNINNKVTNLDKVTTKLVSGVKLNEVQINKNTVLILKNDTNLNKFHDVGGGISRTSYKELIHNDKNNTI